MTISLKRLDQVEENASDISLVGTRVRSIRQSVGYSIEDLAETCGLTSAEITGIEEGLDVDMGQLKRVAAALQVSVSDLLDGQE
jgi:transcriptional regulator with XRE-family HTH domain